ncbi:MAG: c-type cytochrome [Pseudomonadota bacterium]
MKYLVETPKTFGGWVAGCLLMLGLAGCSGADDPSASRSSSGEQGQTASAPPPEHPGKKIYNRYCFSCHGAGLSGAPKLGDAEAWAPRIAKGNAAMLKTTIEGMGAMPPRGICMACSDEELAEAIAYMVSTVE